MRFLACLWNQFVYSDGSNCGILLSGIFDISLLAAWVALDAKLIPGADAVQIGLASKGLSIYLV